MKLIWPLVGILSGLINALTLSATVRRWGMDVPTRGWGTFMAGMAGRWLMSAALLAVAFGGGLFEGLLALAGFWVARWATILWWHLKE